VLLLRKLALRQLDRQVITSKPSSPASIVALDSAVVATRIAALGARSPICAPTSCAGIVAEVSLGAVLTTIFELSVPITIPEYQERGQSGYKVRVRGFSIGNPIGC
jgi:hypothetical protein